MEAVTNNRFVTSRCCFCFGAFAIAGDGLPAPAAVVCDCLAMPVTLIRGAMLRVLEFTHARSNDNTGARTMTSYSFVCRVTVIGSIPGETGDGRSNLLKQCFKLADVTGILVGENLCNNFASVRIYGKM